MIQRVTGIMAVEIGHAVNVRRRAGQRQTIPLSDSSSFLGGPSSCPLGLKLLLLNVRSVNR